MPVHPLWMGAVLLFLMAVVAVVVLAVVGVTRLQSTPSGPPPGSPLDVLARRFAAGEITAEEYQKARDLLQGGGSKSS